MMDFRLSLMERLAMWWRSRRRQECDSCRGEFRLRDLAATSGDWYMCPACFNRMCEEDRIAEKKR
jgi:hypothetical protein